MATAVVPVTKQTFDQQLETAQRRLEALYQAAEESPPVSKELMAEILAELSISLQELQIAGEELRQQNEELIASRQAIEAERQRYQELFDFAPGGYLVTNGEGIIQEANRAAAVLLGVRQDLLVGKPLAVFVPIEDRLSFRAWLAHLLAEPGPAISRQRWETRLQPRDKPPFEAALMVTPMLNAEDQKVRFRWLVQDITERKQAEVEKERLFQEVSQQRQQLRALTRQLAEAQEVERKELARELHDRLGQKLTALGLNLNLIWAQLAETGAGTGPIQARLDDSLGLIAEMAEHIRDVTANLRPPVLDDYGLVAALRWYSSQLASRVGFTITVQGEEPAPRLATPVENALFRIAQEALTNVAKHARASQVLVTVRANDKTVHLVIVDDGCGFEPARQAERVEQQGWGLITMMERAEAIGGHCHIKSRPGHGTQVIVEVAR